MSPHGERQSGELLNSRMRISAASDSSLLVTFESGEERDVSEISVQRHEEVMALYRYVRGLSDSRIRNVHPAYSSVLVDFDPLLLTHDELAATIRNASVGAAVDVVTNVIELPVCYDAEFAPDLSFVAESTKLSEEKVISMHMSAEYFVCFLGFAPGFAYLGGLPAELHVPRRNSPRQFVVAGSVGLAGSQTGVYPFDSPGGWQIIGRTPLRMFDSHSSRPSRLSPGDVVRFRQCSREEFDEIAEAEN